MIDQVYTAPAESVLLDKSATLLYGLWADVAEQFVPLDDVGLTGRRVAELMPKH
ncbi:MAG: hypothetical protein ACRDOB_29600 [Streptosporangiaceae bacterium]